MKAWAWFVIVQLISLVATIFGWLLLIPFCLGRCWLSDPRLKSIKDGRQIDDWDVSWLNAVYGNPEDGVSGQFALINGNQPYMPNAWAPWRAYCWSAWRNSADNLKYVFRWHGGPFRRWEAGAFYVQAGWNTSGLPVISAGRI